MQKLFFQLLCWFDLAKIHENIAKASFQYSSRVGLTVIPATERQISSGNAYREGRRESILYSLQDTKCRSNEIKYQSLKPRICVAEVFLILRG
jgi:hypothetical protein